MSSPEEMQQPEFKPVTIEVAEIGKQVLKFVFMTAEELDFWWENGRLKYDDEALGKKF